jgi:cystathionine gamma-synthase
VLLLVRVDVLIIYRKVHAVGGILLVDSTFAPPPLQYPFRWGADCVLHSGMFMRLLLPNYHQVLLQSGSKYFGGHSDLLNGILVMKTCEEREKVSNNKLSTSYQCDPMHAIQLYHDRIYLGNVMGSLEAWLLLRSLKTHHLRVPRQSETATALVKWLDYIASTPAGQKFEGIPGGLVTKVLHSSLQKKDARDFEPSEQMEGGWNATFAIHVRHLSCVLFLWFTIECTPRVAFEA